MKRENGTFLDHKAKAPPPLTNFQFSYSFSCNYFILSINFSEICFSLSMFKILFPDSSPIQSHNKIK